MESLIVDIFILNTITFSRMPSVRAKSNKLQLKKCFRYLFRIKARFINLPVVRISYFCVLLTFVHHIWLYLIISNRSADIEKNPGPKPNPCQSFSICHWNLNSISAHNFLKLSLLQAYIAVHNFDVTCLSETYLDLENCLYNSKY